MKTHNLLIYNLLLCVLCLFSACEDDNEMLYTGEENYIASFRLVQGEQSYAGLVSGDTLLLSLPENVALDGATVEFELSELATIAPNPDSVTDWTAERTFTVTSYNATPRTYKYYFRRELAAQAGDVILNTAEELEAFAAKGISKIEGNLVIGKLTGTVAADTLTTLASLASLKEVTGTLTINPTYGGTSLEGLHNLEKIGGFNMVGRTATYGNCGFTTLRSIDLPALRSVGSSMTLSADTLDLLNLPALKSVGGSLSFVVRDIRQADFSSLEVIGADFTAPGWNSTIYLPERLEFPRLARIGGKLELKNPHRLQAYLFPALASVSSLYLSQTDQLAEVDFSSLATVADQLNLEWTHEVREMRFPALTSVGSFRVYYIRELTLLDFPLLASVGNKGFSIDACDKLTDISLPLLKKVEGNYALKSMNITDLSPVSAIEEVGGNFEFTSDIAIPLDGFNNLRTVGGNFTLSGPLTSLGGCNALASIGGNLSLNGMPSLTSIDGLASLSHIGGSVTLSSLSALSSFDISNLPVTQMTLTGMLDGFTLKGQSRFDGTLTLNTSKGVRFDGIEEITTLSVTLATQNTEAECSFPGLKRVGDLTTGTGWSANSARLVFPDLEEVTGTFKMSDGSSYAARPSRLPLLRSVGALDYSGTVDTLTLPALVEVAGDLSIKTSASSKFMLEIINMPGLKRVGGTLSLNSSSYQASGYNTLLTNLNCFSSLESAAAIDIQKQMALVDYSGLARLIPSLPGPDAWTVTGNAWNPTWEQAQSGILTQPLEE